MDIEDVFSEYRDEIDKRILRYIPKQLDKGSFELACGIPRYAYDFDAASRSVNKPIWDLLGRGGKRWRPVLLLLTAEAFGGDAKKLLDVSIIPEVVHNGTLMVDDIEDNSDNRRGKPCIHKIYGNDVAINAGNAMYFLPLLVLMRNRKKFPEKTLLDAYEIYSQEMINISYGQGLDIAWHNAPESKVSEKQYLQMCAFKTGTLARMAAKFGALFAGANEKEIGIAGEFAEAIGIAFQIQDDILNLEGNEKEYGKEIGGDISEGKITLILIHALENASESKRKRLVEILKKHTKKQDEIREAIRIVEETGSIKYAKEYARKMVENAWKKFEGVLKDSEAKKKLKLFADYLIERSY